MSKPWTDKEDALLTQLWKQMPASQISKKMGRSRNGIIGRANRLGLDRKDGGGGRPRKLASPHPLPESAKRPGKPFVFKPSTDANRKPVQRVAGPQPWLGNGVHLLETTHGQCRAILGSSNDARGLAICCGKPIKEGTGFSFCADHHAEYTDKNWRR